MVASEYTVRLDAFEGPLDLLLYLIRRSELDITAISLATLTDQYLAHLGDLERVDVDRAGEFLLMAATLVELKSRMLGSASGAAGDPEEGSPRSLAEPSTRQLAADLIRQLLEYKAYRDAADELEARRDAWLRRYPAARAATDRKALLEAVRTDEIDLEDITVSDLVNAFQRILDTVQFDRLGEHEVLSDDTPIELHAADLVDLLEWRAAGRATDPRLADEPEGLSLTEVFSGRSHAELVGMFIALLELARQRRIRIFAQGVPDPVRTGRPTPDQLRVALRDPESEPETDPDAEPHAGTDLRADAAPSAGGHPSSNFVAWEDDHLIDEDELEPEDDE
ncbi:MAG: segregation and condensation protein A [Phycisphaerales bacterium]